MCIVTINDIPNEVLEIIFSMIPSVVDQINLCLVCQQWRHIILGLRHFHRKHLVRKRKARNKTQGASQNFTFDRHVYMRLPVAGSLNDWGHGNEGFGVLLGLKCAYPILLCGLSIFLPHPNFIRKYNSITVFKEGWNDNLQITIKIHEHGTSQIGPIGQCISETSLELSASDIYQWGQYDNCPSTMLEKNIGAKNIANVCLPGPWMANRSLDATSCNGIHPFPMFFDSSIIIWPSIKYEISLFLVWEKYKNETVTTIWGFQGVPKIKIPFQDSLFTWQQIYRKGLSSSVTSGQFPILMYIR